MKVFYSMAKRVTETACLKDNGFPMDVVQRAMAAVQMQNLGIIAAWDKWPDKNQDSIIAT